MVRRTSQVFRPHPVPNDAEPRIMLNWIALQFRDLANYVVSLEERIRPAVFWASLTDQIIGADIPFTIWPVDVILREDLGEGDYEVTISAICLGTGGITEVQFGLSQDPTSPIIPTAIIPLKNGEELSVSLTVILDNAEGLVVWYRGINVDITSGRVVAVRIGA